MTALGRSSGRRPKGKSSIERTPLRHRCTPEDIAETIVYLGFAAPMITGQSIVIDGGLTL
ncbi:SDR family oxidoreductase [Bradyrhizobium yuanmingense]|uniref:SDR family oxidoreductase n=1 Tax=Bradyrhizobium yuanmingense TaxID=108015 RepID=UPI0018D26BAE